MALFGRAVQRESRSVISVSDRKGSESVFWHHHESGRESIMMEELNNIDLP